MKDARDPFAGESLDGYLAYRAEHMGLPDIGEIAAMVGVDRPCQVRCSRGEDAGLEDVADMLGLPSSAVRRLATPWTSEPGRRAVFGASVHIGHLHRRRRLFAPEAIARSPHHRGLWDLRPFPFDDGTGELLGHRCPDAACDRSQGWNHTRGVDRCDLCGEPLSAGTAATAEAGDLPALRLALGLVHPDADRRAGTAALLPPGLRQWDPGELLDLLVALAGTVDRSIVAQHHPWTVRRDAPAGAVCAAMARAWPLLAGWPEAFEAHALSLALDTPRGRGDGNGGATVRLLDLDRRITIPRALAALVREEREKLASAGRRGGIGAVAASGLRGFRAGDIARARRSGAVPVVASVVRGQFIPMLDRAVVNDLSDRFARSTPLLYAGAGFGCGRLGIEQLHAMDLLGDEPLLRPITGHEARVSIRALDRLSARLAATSVPAAGCWITLEAALRTFGGSPKPIGPLVAAMLGGDLPFHLPEAGGPPFRRMRVPPEALPTILGMRFDREAHRDRLCVDAVSKIEAGWELNLKAKHWVEELAAWPNRGTRPAVPVEWLLEAMRSRISNAEAARVLGRHGNGARRRMQVVGVAQAGVHMLERASFESVRPVLERPWPERTSRGPGPEPQPASTSSAASAEALP